MTYLRALKTAGIGFGNFFFFLNDLSQCFWEHWNRYRLCQRFWKRWYRPFKFYSFMTYTSAGIGITYASAFKSAGTGSKNAGIGYIYIFIKAVPTQVKTLEQGLKVPGPIKALVQVCVTLSPHSKANGLKCREKKCRDRNFDPIPALFGAIPALFKTLG